ncbi:MAG: class I mannose-6-phosphate isomerase [Opitutales bacterium]
MNIPDVIKLPPNRVWRTYSGGKTLDAMEGKAVPEDAHFPEDWIGSTTQAKNIGREALKDEGLASVSIEGETTFLKTLCESHPDAILGAEHVAKYGNSTGYLVKFLDSAIRLHIQCHPTIPFAKKYLNSNHGKTEAYVILGFRDEVVDPYIYMGFQRPPEKGEFKRIIEEQDIESMLACFDKVPVQVGDVFLVPGGMPHAIGEGVFMIEIMEPSDLVVRIEFERGGYVLPESARFMDRGVDFALTMFDYNPVTVDQLKERFFCEPEVLDQQGESVESILIDERKTSCFRVNRLKVQGTFKRTFESFCIGIVTSGSGTIMYESTCLSVSEGERFFVPAKAGELCLESNNGMELVLAFPPKP